MLGILAFPPEARHASYFSHECMEAWVSAGGSCACYAVWSVPIFSHYQSSSIPYFRVRYVQYRKGLSFVEESKRFRSVQQSICLQLLSISVYFLKSWLPLRDQRAFLASTYAYPESCTIHVPSQERLAGSTHHRSSTPCAGYLTHPFRKVDDFAFDFFIFLAERAAMLM
jgi:hypothetical protein